MAEMNGMRPASIEGAEPVAESGAADGLQGQPRHVLGDVDPTPIVSRAIPVIEHVADRLQHDRVVALHRLTAERRLQNVVCQFPIRVFGLDRDEGVADHLAQRRQVVADIFAESGFVVHLGDQIKSADGDHLGAEHFARRDRAQLLRLRQRRLERSAGVQTEDITQQRQPERRVGKVASVDNFAAAQLRCA